MGFSEVLPACFWVWLCVYYCGGMFSMLLELMIVSVDILTSDHGMRVGLDYCRWLAYMYVRV
jgi:hypothetical protein